MATRRDTHLEQDLVDFGVGRNLHLVQLLVELGRVVVDVLDLHDDAGRRRELRGAVVHHEDLQAKLIGNHYWFKIGHFTLTVSVFWAGKF